MRRRIFIVLTSISLLICALLSISAIRSYWQADSVSVVMGRKHSYLRTADGKVVVGFVHYGPSYPPKVSNGVRFNSASVAPTIELFNLLYTDGAILGFNLVHSVQPYDPAVGSPVYYPGNRQSLLQSGPPLAAAPAGSARLESIRTIDVVFPHWMLMAMTAILPAIWVRKKLRSRRQCREGQCPKCGYDLRASPERCPECGTGTESMGGAADSDSKLLSGL